MNARAIAVVAVLVLAAVAGCAAPAGPGQSRPASTWQATPVPEPSCACSYPPTPPAGAVSRDAAVAAALRTIPGVDPATKVVNVIVDSDPLGSGRQIWMVRLGEPLALPSCSCDPTLWTPAPASEKPCLDGDGGVWVLVDIMTGSVLGWTH